MEGRRRREGRKDRHKGGKEDEARKEGREQKKEGKE